MQLVVHGGAGGAPDEPEARRAVLEAAAAAGERAASPLDAVEAALAVLESSPRFNAGLGGAVQADGVVRTDAGVMTDDRRVGAVCAMPGVVHATAVARFVLERTPHVLVAGEHAVGLAALAGLETGVDLLTDETRARYAAAEPPAGDLPTTLDWVGRHFGRAAESTDEWTADVAGVTDTADAPPDDHDTVGVVAVDGTGGLAAATSTGGRWFALPGRVGDSPQAGAGFYAASAGGASATGAGEDIVRATLCRDAVGRLEMGTEPQTAADEAIAQLEDLTDGEAGVIVADRRGRVGLAYNTESMQTATAGEAD